MDLPRISLVTCSYNQGEFLERTIRSVLAQNYPNLEYIVVDGGSTDESVEIIQRYDEHISYWVSEPDDGQTDALIKGFARSTGTIQGWLCSDDLLEPNALHEVAEFFAANPAAEIVYGDSWWIDRDGRPIGPKKEHDFSRFIWLYWQNYLPQPSTFWKRELYERVGGLDPAFHVAMDAELWMRFAATTTVHHVARQWSRMRFYPEQKNRRLRHESDIEGRRIHDRYLGDTPGWQRQAGRAAARALRVARKVRQGCYW